MRKQKFYAHIMSIYLADTTVKVKVMAGFEVKPIAESVWLTTGELKITEISADKKPEESKKGENTDPPSKSQPKDK